MADPDVCVRHRRMGFTLLEILIVVVILGILAGLTVPQFVNAAQESTETSFVTSIKTLARQIDLFELENGFYPEDASSGVIPAGFDDYITNFNWSQTPIGGVWDTEFESFGIISAVGVHFDGTGETRDDDYMLNIDAMMDDGDLTTGAFQRLAGDRYYWIVAD